MDPPSAAAASVAAADDSASAFPVMPLATSDSLYTLLDFLCGALTRAGVTHWPDGGTVLGLVRHKGIIGWDDDADLCAFDVDRGKVQDIADDVARHADTESNADATPACPHSLFAFHETFFGWKVCFRPPLGAAIRGCSWTYPSVDIFFVDLPRPRRAIDASDKPVRMAFSSAKAQKCWGAMNFFAHEILQPPIAEAPEGKGEDHEARTNEEDDDSDVESKSSREPLLHYSPSRHALTPQVFGPLSLWSFAPLLARQYLSRSYGSDWEQVAYRIFDHALEKKHEPAVRAVKVPLTPADRRPAGWSMPRPAVDCTCRGVESKSRVGAGMHSLAPVEVQSVMHFLSRVELILFARSSRRTLAAASSTFPWTHANRVEWVLPSRCSDFHRFDSASYERSLLRFSRGVDLVYAHSLADRSWTAENAGYLHRLSEEEMAADLQALERVPVVNSLRVQSECMGVVALRQLVASPLAASVQVLSTAMLSPPFGIEAVLSPRGIDAMLHSFPAAFPELHTLSASHATASALEAFSRLPALTQLSLRGENRWGADPLPLTPLGLCARLTRLQLNNVDFSAATFDALFSSPLLQQQLCGLRIESSLIASSDRSSVAALLLRVAGGLRALHALEFLPTRVTCAKEWLSAVPHFPALRSLVLCADRQSLISPNAAMGPHALLQLIHASPHLQITVLTGALRRQAFDDGVAHERLTVVPNRSLNDRMEPVKVLAAKQPFRATRTEPSTQ